VLIRLIEPDEGRILLDEVPLSRLPLAQLRRSIAVVPQETMLFNDSLAYNIALGRAGATLAEIQQAARIAHLHEFIMSLPDGYDTRVGERGMKLSGGERQRVSIARAVLASPILYVFDEATAALDSRTEQDILVSLREIAAHRSTLMIAHRLAAIVDADEIVVLEGGRIVERGTHYSLLRDNGAYAAAWRAQQPGAPIA
jgi:ABC-type multidrug transport system fused ATPase/permease subunit